jgi:hypothetical protein
MAQPTGSTHMQISHLAAACRHRRVHHAPRQRRQDLRGAAVYANVARTARAL